MCTWLAMDGLKPQRLLLKKYKFSEFVVSVTCWHEKCHCPLAATDTQGVLSSNYKSIMPIDLTQAIPYM